MDVPSQTVLIQKRHVSTVQSASTWKGWVALGARCASLAQLATRNQVPAMRFVYRVHLVLSRRGWVKRSACRVQLQEHPRQWPDQPTAMCAQQGETNRIQA
jgi:hypothetical protein